MCCVYYNFNVLFCTQGGNKVNFIKCSLKLKFFNFNLRSCWSVARTREGMEWLKFYSSSMFRKVYWVNLTNYCGNCVENKLANYQYCDIWWRSKCHLNMVWSRGDLGLILVTMVNSILQHQCNMLLASNTVILNLYFLLAMTVIIKLYQKE